jgi:hypothetical protein
MPSPRWREQLRFFSKAAVERPLASGVELAPGRQRKQAGNDSRDWFEPAPVLADRAAGNRVHEPLGVGMERIFEKLFYTGMLHDTSGVHHKDLLGHLGYHAKVMGNKQNRHTVRLAQIIEKRKYLCLDGYVQGGRGFIGDNEARATGYGYRYHYPLAHTAAHLMRIVPHPDFRQWDTNPVQKIDNLKAGLFFRDPLVPQKHLSDLIFDTENGVERSHRLLENHRYFVSPYRLHYIFRNRKKLFPPKQDLTTCHHARGRNKAHNGKGAHAFAASGLADNSQHLSFGHLKADRINRTRYPRLGQKICFQVFYFEKSRIHHSPMPGHFDDGRSNNPIKYSYRRFF